MAKQTTEKKKSAGSIKKTAKSAHHKEKETQKTGAIAKETHKKTEEQTKKQPEKPAEHTRKESPKEEHEKEVPKQAQEIVRKEEKKIVEQAIVNIGMVGHVDHGKCIAAEELLLLNSELAEGTRMLNIAEEHCNNLPISETETIFEIPNLKAFSLSQTFEPVSVNTKLFVQNYSGNMFEIKTKRGKCITISPKHPLLVNNGSELVWKNSETLKTGDFIASLRKIPDQGFLKDCFQDWIEKLSEKCWVVDSKDFDSLSKKTDCFENFSELNPFELNKIRIFLKKSTTSFEKECGFYSGELANMLRNKKINANQRKKLPNFFENAYFSRPNGKIINFKKKSQNFCEINFEDYWNDSALKLLAFIISEGCLTSNSMRFSQEKNELLSEILKICEKLFSTCPKFYPPFDYQINNKALVCFLQEKYGLKTGNSRAAGIPEWVFTLPKQKLAVFINWFFSAEANFNQKSNQIALIQANKKSIQVLSYSLKKFGINHSVHEIEKCATNSTKKTKRTYWQLLISGIENISEFKRQIGVTLPKKQEALDKIAAQKQQGKRTDEMIPLQFKLLSELAENIGWKKKNYSKKSKALRSNPCFWAYNDCRTKNAISKENLKRILEECQQRIKYIEKLVRQLKENNLEEIMAETSISQQEIAKRLKVSQKNIWKILRGKNTEKKQTLTRIVTWEIEKKLEKAKKIFEKIYKNSPKNIEWDKIAKIKKINYQGKIIDLQVPGYHNFIAGLGAIISHNTSLTQALTGKWTETHSEELKRGISIRLGYADTTFYKCPKCNGSEAYTIKPICANCANKAEKIRTASFVDAPGHETLLATMLSGAVLMHGAILVIAANEQCPQPQTTEHLIALKIAGIKNIIVAQNKIDLVDKTQALENFKQIKEFLKTQGLEEIPIIPVAANMGTNIDLLIETIEEKIPTPKLELDKPVKAYCIRSFDVNKPGTKISEIKGGVLGGSIIQGKIKIGDKIEITPGIEGTSIQTIVKSLSCAHGNLQEAKPGGLIGIGTELDPSITQNDRMRGQIIAMPGIMPMPAKKVHLKINFMERLIANIDQKLKTNETLVLTIGAMTALGTIIKEKNEVFEIDLRIPVVIEKNQKIAISKKEAGRWRLIGYATAE